MEVAWRSDGGRLAAAGSDGAIWIFEPDGTRVAALNGHHRPVNFVNWRPGSSQLISACGTAGMVLSWNGETGEAEWVSMLLPNHRAVTFSAAGELIGGDADVVEQEFVYLVETESGAVQMMTRSEFEARR